MERQIRAEFWKNKQFAVQISSANKQQRGFSFKNESPCCAGAEMGVKSYCKQCNELTDKKEVANKLFKLGKDMLRIPARAIEAIKIREEKSDIVLTVAPVDIEQVYAMWADFDDWLGDQKYIEQADKKEGDHALLKEALKGKMAFGKAKFGFSEYAVAVYVTRSNKLRLRMLVEPSQRNKQSEEKEVSVSEAMVNILRQISEKNAQPLPTLSDFAEDGSRKELESLIEKAVSGEIIVAEVVKETQGKKEADELAELQKLLVEVN